MQEEQIINIIRTTVTAGIPAIVTVITYIRQSNQSRKHAAKQSILQMIMEDPFNWELFQKFPVNYGNIMNEYEVYHTCGGNGEVTKKVQEYKAWYEENECSMKQMRSYKCEPQITVSCRSTARDNLSKRITNKVRRPKQAKRKEAI